MQLHAAHLLLRHLEVSASEKNTTSVSLKIRETDSSSKSEGSTEGGGKSHRQVTGFSRLYASFSVTSGQTEGAPCLEKLQSIAHC